MGGGPCSMLLTHAPQVCDVEGERGGGESSPEPPTLLPTHLQSLYFGQVGSSVANPWVGTSGGYTAVYAALATASPPVLDWFNVQCVPITRLDNLAPAYRRPPSSRFYNLGTSTCFTTYESVFVSSSWGCADFPGASVSEIIGYGVPAEAIVVGKPVRVDDGTHTGLRCG